MIKSEQIVGVVGKLAKYRKEIIRAVTLLVLTMVLVYFESDLLVKFLSKPLNKMPLFFLTPVEGIMIKIKIAFLGGIIITLPIIGYRVVSLLPSKVTKKTKRFLRFFILPFIIIAFAGGVAFAYYLVLPATIDFLISCGNEFMKAAISGSSYFSFITILMVIIGIIFELPFILVALSKVGIVSYNTLSKKRKIAIILILVIVAFITPTPDAFTMIIVSLPMMVLYEFSIWWIFLLEKKKIKNLKKAAQ